MDTVDVHTAPYPFEVVAEDPGGPIARPHLMRYLRQRYELDDYWAYQNAESLLRDGIITQDEYQELMRQ